jgi:hypothetical protein
MRLIDRVIQEWHGSLPFLPETLRRSVKIHVDNVTDYFAEQYGDVAWENIIYSFSNVIPPWRLSYFEWRNTHGAFVPSGVLVDRRETDEEWVINLFSFFSHPSRRGQIDTTSWSFKLTKSGAPIAESHKTGAA